MSKTLEAIREKYPQYEKVPDAELAGRIALKYPVYADRDTDFEAESSQWIGQQFQQHVLEAKPDETGRPFDDPALPQVRSEKAEGFQQVGQQMSNQQGQPFAWQALMDQAQYGPSREASRMVGDVRRAEQGIGTIDLDRGPDLPKVSQQDLETLGLPKPVAGLAAGGQQALVGLTEFLLSPEGMAYGPASPIMRAPGMARVVTQAFLGDMAVHAPGQLKAGVEALQKGDYEEAGLQLTSGGMAIGFIGHGLKSPKTAATELAKALDKSPLIKAEGRTEKAELRQAEPPARPVVEVDPLRREQPIRFLPKEESALQGAEIGKAEVRSEKVETSQRAPLGEAVEATAELLSPVPDSITVRTPKGNRIARVAASHKDLDSSKPVEIQHITLSDPATGSKEFIGVPSGKTYPTLEEAGQAGFDLIRTKYPEVKSLATPPKTQGIQTSVETPVKPPVTSLKPTSKEEFKPVETPKEAAARSAATIEQATLPRRIEAPKLDSPAGEPVSIASIREYLSQALDIPMRVGVRVPGGIRQALGLFRVKPETIRLKTLNDLPTIAHEVGHYLHWILFPKRAQSGPGDVPGPQRFGPTLDAELMALGKRTSLPSYKPVQVQREGVAEFFREWLTDRSQALAKAPEFTRFFERELSTRTPEIWKIVTTAREQTQRFINQPAVEKVKSQMSLKPEDNRVRLWSRFEKLYSDWVDELAPLERAEKRFMELGLDEATARQASKLAVNYMGGWRGKVEYSLFKKQIDYNGNPIGPSLKDIMSGLKSLDDFRVYLVSPRVLELSKRGKETGIDPRDAAEVVKQLAREHEPRRRKLAQFLRNELKLLEDAGIISAAERKKMEAANRFYVPFHRLQEPVSGRTGGGGTGFVDTGRGVKGFKGDTQKIIDPLESVIKNMYLFRDLAERNRVGQAFTDAAESVRGGGRVVESIARKTKPTKVSDAEVRQKLESEGVPKELIEELLGDKDLSFKVWRAARSASEREGIFTVWKNGKETAWQIADGELYRALKLMDSMDGKVMARMPALKPLAAITHTLRAGATLTMEFLARNWFRDQVTAAIYSKYGYLPFFDGFRGMLTALGRTDLYWQWVKAGGRYADFMAADRKDITKKLADVTQDRTVLDVVRKYGNPVATLQKANEIMEQATRISEFRRAKRAGASDLDAANAAKDVTLNFSRFGFKGKLVNQLVAFFNAQIRDVEKFMRMHKTAPARTVFKGLAYVTAPSILTWWAGKDDPEIQNLPDWRKNFFWNINFRPIAAQAGIQMDDFVLSIPKPFLVGTIYGTSVERALDTAYGNDPNGVKKWFAALLQSNPLPVTLSGDNSFRPELNMNVMPTGIKPFIEMAANYDFFRDAPIEGMGMERLPAEMRSRPDTPETLKQIGQLTGTSPLKLQHGVRGVTGGLGAYGLGLTDYLLAQSGLVNVPERAEMTLRERPLFRAFSQSPYAASANVHRFYRGMEGVEQQIAGLRKLATEVNEDKARDFFNREPDKLAYYLAGNGAVIKYLRQGESALGDINKAMLAVQQSRELTPAEKRERLLLLSEQRNTLAEHLFKALHPTDRKRVY